MNFFQQLAEISNGLDLTIRVKSKNEKLTLSVLPDNVGNIQPLLITGTPEDLDKGFIEAIRQPMADTALVVSNKDEYNKNLQEIDEENKEEAAPKSKPAAKPSGKTKDKNAKKVQPKPEIPKAAVVAEPEAPAGPQQLTIG